MKLPIYQVDAFSEKVFGGNPAAVCPLTEWLPDATMQAIAAENNLSETAFFVENTGGYDLRWFTPETEVDLCGHATLASAHVILEFLDRDRDGIAFSTRSGVLTVTREGDRLAMTFPASPPRRVESDRWVAEALGAEPAELFKSNYLYALFGSEEEVKGLKPSMEKLRELDAFALVPTAPGKEVDFVSRVFAPKLGIPEDPVTGSAHCGLVPLWAERLNKTKLHARQVSGRGGQLSCEHLGERVKMSGHCTLYLVGDIHV